MIHKTLNKETSRRGHYAFIMINFSFRKDLGLFPSNKVFWPMLVLEDYLIFYVEIICRTSLFC